MGISEIARELQMSEAAVRMHISRGLKKLASAGQAENFAKLVRHVEIKEQIKETGPLIRCGSLECRADWICTWGS